MARSMGGGCGASARDAAATERDEADERRGEITRGVRARGSGEEMTRAMIDEGSTAREGAGGRLGGEDETRARRSDSGNARGRARGRRPGTPGTCADDAVAGMIAATGDDEGRLSDEGAIRAKDDGRDHFRRAGVRVRVLGLGLGLGLGLETVVVAVAVAVVIAIATADTVVVDIARVRSRALGLGLGLGRRTTRVVVVVVVVEIDLCPARSRAGAIHPWSARLDVVINSSSNLRSPSRGGSPCKDDKITNLFARRVVSRLARFGPDVFVRPHSRARSIVRPDRACRINLDMSASKNNVVEAGAGAAGALVALLVTYPLITLNTRQHVTRREAGAEGDERARTSSVKPSSLAALYDGIEPAIVGTVVSQAVYNYWYARANGTYARRWGREPTGAASLAIASFAGCVNVLMTLPIWTIVTRMQANVKKREEASEESESEEDVTREVEKKRRDKSKRRGKPSFFDVAAEIARDGGITGFWQGLTPSLVMVSNPALQYAFYETAARRRLKSQAKSNLSALEVFCLGAYAKFGATVLTYPLQVIKSRLQVVSKDMADERMRYRGAAHAFRVMARDEGLPAFFRGIETKLAQTILAAALMFTVKEKLAEATYRRVAA